MTSVLNNSLCTWREENGKDSSADLKGNLSLLATVGKKKGQLLVK